ncbi:MAG: S8 family serine peptidase [Chloroflexi bacterium]|nr:S8 family serine peptidase [Chloroflexota bacterium]
MIRFIALRKVPLAVQRNLQDLPAEAKRAAVVKTASEMDESAMLQSLGLRYVPTGQSAPYVEHHFQQLDWVGAYVVETTSPEVAARARVLLEPEYVIIPDIQLALPRPTLLQRYRRRPTPPELWPVESGIAEAHKKGFLGEGVMVGVLDTGCDADHIELRHKVVDFRYVPLDPTSDPVRACRGFDVDGHGTHVCGIIAGEHLGIAPKVDLMVASVIESETLRTSLERVVIALDWMLSKFRLEENLDKPAIINMSLGFRDASITPDQFDGILKGLKQILTTLVIDFDVLPIVAVGNDGPDTMRAPAYFTESMSVGAVDAMLRPAIFSGGGISPVTRQVEPDIVGYGIDIISSLERDIHNHSIYARMSGTSMAAPYVTGIAALVASANPQLRGASLRQYLTSQALNLNLPAERVGVGLARFIAP